MRGGKLIAEGCAKVAACRNEAIEKGLGFLVGVGATTTVLEKLSPSDQQYVLGVAMNGGHADAVAQLTSEQRAAYDYIVAQDKQGAFQLLPAQQSSSGDKPASTPNIGKDLSDADKAEIGGVGSGTGTPPPPKNDSNQQNNKPTQNLNQKQESAIKKIDNTIKNALKDHDITGTIKDMDGNPVPKPNGGSWDHMQEMQNTLRGLRNNAETLKNVNNPEAQAAYGRATDAINKIESALKGHGI